MHVYILTAIDSGDMAAPDYLHSLIVKQMGILEIRQSEINQAHYYQEKIFSKG